MEILYGYVAPEVSIVEIEVEKGYAGSTTGGGFAPGEGNYDGGDEEGIEI